MKLHCSVRCVVAGLITITLSSALLTRAADDDLVKNGDFEKPEVGVGFTTYAAGQSFGEWSVDSGSVDHIGDYWKAAKGQQSIDMCGGEAGVLYQDLATVDGKSYVLRFAMAGNMEGGDAMKKMEVAWGDRKLDPLSFDSTGRTKEDMGWKHFEFKVVAKGTKTRVAFKSLTDGACGPTLDDVSVKEMK